jgi:RNA polymerase sigma-70 factor (ECF subfamily)
MKLEAKLLSRAHAFDMDALAEIYDQFSPGVYRYAARLLDENSLAEDCVADTFSRFLQALRNGGGPQEYLQAYLYRIAHNWVTDYYRKSPSLMMLDDESCDGTIGPDGQAADRQEKQRLRRALMKLTPEQRQVIMLKYFEDMDNASIAYSTGRPLTAVKSLMHRGMAALRRVLAFEEDKI